MYLFQHIAKVDVSVRREAGVLEIEAERLRAVVAVVEHDRDIAIFEVLPPALAIATEFQK